MTTFSFAINTRREYYAVEATSEEEARKLLEESIDGEDNRRFYSGQNLDMQEIELIDVDD